MAVERTFGIIKPDAVKNENMGEILVKIREAGLKPVGAKLSHLSKEKAEGFYAVHKDRPFFGELVEFMTSGPCLVMCLEGEGAILKWRDTMGATNPEEAEAGTIRKLFGANIGNNAVHGSDAPETAAFEVGYFFDDAELVAY